METITETKPTLTQAVGNIEWVEGDEESNSTNEKIPYFRVKNGESKSFRLLTQPTKHWVHYSGKDSSYWQIACNGKGSCFVCDHELKYETQKALGVGNKTIYRAAVWNNTDGAFQIFTMGKQVFEQINTIRLSEDERKNVNKYDFKISAKKGNTPYYSVTALSPKPLSAAVIAQLQTENFALADVPVADQTFLAKKVGNSLNLI